MNMHNQRGQVSVAVAIITGAGMVIASALTSWATTNSNIAQVKEDAATIKVTENLHYMEVQKDLARVEKKIDQLVDIFTQ